MKKENFGGLNITMQDNSPAGYYCPKCNQISEHWAISFNFKPSKSTKEILYCGICWQNLFDKHLGKLITLD